MPTIMPTRMPTARRYGGHGGAMRLRRRGVMRVVSALAKVVCVAGLALVAGCASQGSNGALVGAGSSPTSGSTAPSATPGGTITVKDDSNGTTVHVHVGTEVELLLSSSYWSVNGSSAARVLKQDGASTVLPRPTSCPAIPGLGCQPVQTNFTAMSVGTSIITANRTTCGEALRCPPDKQHFLVTIVVQ